MRGLLVAIAALREATKGAIEGSNSLAPREATKGCRVAPLESPQEGPRYPKLIAFLLPILQAKVSLLIYKGGAARALGNLFRALTFQSEKLKDQGKCSIITN